LQNLSVQAKSYQKGENSNEKMENAFDWFYDGTDAGLVYRLRERRQQQCGR
jgi:hypothetical protein